MIKINIDELTNRIKEYPTEVQALLLNPEKNIKILSILQSNNIKDQEEIDSISNGVRLIATRYMSKTDFYELIKFRLNGDEFLARKLFSELDTGVMLPNKFIGAIDNNIEKSGEDKEDIDTKTEDEDDSIYNEINVDYTPEEQAFLDSTENESVLTPPKEETAEDILREIENPTPSFRLPIINQNIQPSETKETIEDKKLQMPEFFAPAIPSTTPVVEIPKINLLDQTILTTALPPTPAPLPTPKPSTPTPTLSPTNKEDGLDIKLVTPVVQPAKSTYYKVDPYREQAE